MIGQTLKGIGYLARGIPLLLRPGVRRHVLAPLAINLLLFVLLIALGIRQFADLLDGVLAALPAALQWLAWLVWPLFLLVLLSAGFLIGLMLAGLIAAPFNAALAAAVEARLGGRAPHSGGGTFAVLREAGRGIASEARKLAYFSLRAVPLLVLFLIPGINLVAAPLWLLFGIWMLALEFIEIPLGNHGLTFPEVRRRLAGRKPLALGFGGAALILTSIPLLNFVTLPAVVAGATLLAAGEGLADGRVDEGRLRDDG